MIKVLNLYAGIGGNRKLWPKECKVTAVEINPGIAKIYKDFFPNDRVIAADAHKYLLENYGEFDFIWSSPPCPTHSRMRLLCMQKEGAKPKYPDMKLYEEIIFLKHFFKRRWVVENTISYYKPLIKPHISGKHYFWANFHIVNKRLGIRRTRRKRGDSHKEHFEELQSLKGFEINYEMDIMEKIKLLNNCVEPKLGLHIFNCAFKEKQMTL